MWGEGMRTQDEMDEDRMDARMEEDESMVACDDCGRMVKTTHSGPGGMNVCGACLSAYLPDENA